MRGADRAPDGKRILSVSGLLETGRSVLESAIGPVWVEAEVFEYRGPHAGSGHAYFKLRDRHASMNAILWRGVAAKAVQCDLREGQQVLVRGRFDIYAARGTLSFVLEHVQDRGVGDLAQRFEVLKKQLHAEGLFDVARKQELPTLPRQVVLITASGSAAEADILHVFRASRNPVHVLVRPTRVQGDAAVGDLLAALEEAQEIQPDMIMLSRGGGSLEDLWSFNEESLVRAVAECEVPVLSAVGHEVDFTLCDFAADERAITPTAGAQRIVAPWVEHFESVSSLRQRLARVGGRLLQDSRHRFDRNMERLLAQQPQQRLARQRMRCDHAEQRLVAAKDGLLIGSRARLRQEMRALLNASPEVKMCLARAKMSKASAQLEAGNPMALLERGYALVTTEQDQAQGSTAEYLRDPAAAPEGSVLRIQLARGGLKARVE